jgi:hypothetical protein
VSTVSNLVAVPQVWTVATPDVAGVQLYTRSGAPLVWVTHDVSVLAPEVVPVTVPPVDGSAIGVSQAVTGRIVVDVVVGPPRVLVVELATIVVVVDEVVVLLVVGVLVVVTEEDGGVVEVVVTEVDGGVTVVVVVTEDTGGVTVRVKLPLEPPQEPEKPSTTIQYGWPAVTLRLTREP